MIFLELLKIPDGKFMESKNHQQETAEDTLCVGNLNGN